VLLLIGGVINREAWAWWHGPSDAAGMDPRHR
jgi:hypothetical protein